VTKEAAQGMRRIAQQSGNLLRSAVWKVLAAQPFRILLVAI
jgi:hypothetical protein